MRITVVGDVLLDADLHGVSTRTMPDSAAPVVDVARTDHRPGGAGLAARMLADDGHDVTLVTVLGNDVRAAMLRTMLADVRIVAATSARPTPVKRRVFVEGRALARLDEDCVTADDRDGDGTSSSPAAGTADVVDPRGIADALAEAESVLVSDYGRGLTADPSLRGALADAAARTPLVWDPHPRGTAPVAGTAVATPNRAEARCASGAATPPEAAALLLDLWPVDAAVITLESDGAVLHSSSDRAADATHLSPRPRTSDGDPCGAGDRFASALAAALAAGRALPDAVDASVETAAAWIAAGGVGSVHDRSACSPAIRTHCTAETAASGTAVRSTGAEQSTGPDRAESDVLRVLASVRASGGTIVATGGCFDLLHAGHVRTLTHARALGDALIVCLNADASVHRLKGDGRPIIGEDDRAELLRSLDCVDAVVVFDEDTPHAVLERLRPDLWVKGGDYDADSLPEAQLVHGWGGRTATVPFHPARSTTHLADALTRLG